MKDITKKLTKNEKGLTLTEVLASIVILSIIITSVLLIFNQTMRANKTSEEIIDATYVAQNEMELMYHLSTINGKVTNHDYEFQEEKDNWQIYKREFQDIGFYVKVKTQKTSEGMTRVVVYVYDESDNVKSQMESLLKWGSSQ